MREVGIVVFLRDVRKDKIASAGVEAVRVREEFADRVIGKMTGTGKHALLDDPWIRADLEHVQIVIGLENHAVGLAEMDLNHFREIAEIGANGDLCAVGAKSEADRIGGIVRNSECMDIDIADGKVLAGLDRFDAFEALVEGLGEIAAERVQGRFRDIERRGFPEAQHLRETVAVVGVLVSDKDGVEVIEFAAGCGEAGYRFAFTEAGVDEDASALSFKQRKIARAAGRQNGNAQADGKTPRKDLQTKTFQIMAEG